MQPLDSRVVSVSLESYVRDRLAESDFFSGLMTGTVSPEHARDVFAQYYLWRARLHQWLGVCIAKSAAFGDAVNAPLVLSELITCLMREVNGDHHRLAVSFLTALGIDRPTHIRALPVTDAYAESFLRCYLPADRTGAEALAALAGRELVVPGRNSIIVSALPEHYGITSGLEFFRLPADLAATCFPTLWDAIADDTGADDRKLIEAARLEIWEHITFWDDAYSAVLTAGQRPVSDPAMAGNS